jgi:hypothetical protein
MENGMQKRLLDILKWPIALAALAGLLVVVHLVHLAVLAERKEEGEEDKVRAPSRVKNAVVKLGEKLATAQGVKDEEAQAVSWRPRQAVYGRVVANPRATVEVRAPFAGLLRAAPRSRWPGPGDPVKAGQVLGLLDVRVGPQERLDWRLKLKEARLKEKGAEEICKVQQDRVKRLESASGSVSQTDLDTARVQMLQAATELATARVAVKLWEETLAQIEEQGVGTLWSQKLAAPAGGEVAELAARPGMALEAGGLVARIVDFRKVLVRVDAPVSLSLGGRTPPARLLLVGLPGPGQGAENALWANRLGPAPQVDAASQLNGWWYEADLAEPSQTKATPWRPGLFIKTDVPDPREKAGPAVSVPATALIYFQGRPFVYIRVEPGEYQRRPVRVLGRDADAAIVDGVRAGQRVVSHGSQTLLAEEFRPAEGEASQKDDDD